MRFGLEFKLASLHFCLIACFQRKEAEEKSQPIEKQEGKQDSGGTWYTDIPGSSKGKTPEEDEADEKRSASLELYQAPTQHLNECCLFFLTQVLARE